MTIVRSYGPHSAKIAVVGEAPGSHEARLGRPFVGSAGSLLRTMLSDAGIVPASARYMNVMETQPNRNNFGDFYYDKARQEPKPELIQGRARLVAELKALKPNVTIACGNEPLVTLTGKRGIKKWRGSILDTDVGKVIPTLHPAAILRMYSDRPIAQIDFTRAARESDSPDVRRPALHTICNPTLTQILTWLHENAHADICTFDTETLGRYIRCLGLAVRSDEAICIPFMRVNKVQVRGKTILMAPQADDPSYWSAQDETAIIRALSGFFASTKTRFVAQNFAFDAPLMERNWRLRVPHLFLDTMHCIRGSELVDTLQGPKSIKELVGTKPWVWSWKDGKPFPAQASYVTRTKQNAQLVRVFFWHSGGSNGTWVEYVDATPDHRFLTEFGWVEAQKLEPGCRLTRVRLGLLNKHQTIRPTKGKRWVKVSRYVTECLSGLLQEGEIVHHIDGDVTNNAPSNLRRMDDSSHRCLSRPTNCLPPTLRVIWNRDTVEEKVRELYAANMSMYDIAIIFGVNFSTISRFMDRHGIQKRSQADSVSLARSKAWNAKVLGVEVLNETDDVYDMTVPETGCFSVNGVIVHNCHHVCYPEFPKSLNFLTSVYTRIGYYADYDPSSDRETWEYNGLDCMATFQCIEPILAELNALGLRDFYFYHIHPLVLAMTRVQERGVLVDAKRRTELGEPIRKEIDVLREKFLVEYDLKVKKVVSPKQVKAVLTSLGISIPTRNYKQTTDERAMSDLIVRYPDMTFLKDVLLQREKVKFYGTYVTAELDEDDRMRTSYNVSGTKTGRLSSSKTLWGTGGNLQNIPRGEFRRLFIAPPGKVFMHADLSQAETRLVAWFSRNVALIERFLHEPGFDVHTFKATELYGVQTKQVTPEQRFNAKQCNHSGNYRIGWKKFSYISGILPSVARPLLIAHQSDRYLQWWWADVQAQLRNSRTLVTPAPFKRKRIFYGRLDEVLFRESYNYLPQSTVGDIINEACWKLDAALDPDLAVIILQVHDEIDFEVDEKHVLEVAQIIRNALSIELTVHDDLPPLTIPVEITYGPNWHDQPGITDTEEITRTLNQQMLQTLAEHKDEITQVVLEDSK